jgi:hypothetical protein
MAGKKCIFTAPEKDELQKNSATQIVNLGQQREVYLRFEDFVSIQKKRGMKELLYSFRHLPS